MSRVITFSRTFPAYHPKRGQPTYFVEALVNSFVFLGYAIEEIDELCHDRVGLNESIIYSKSHTIRAGNRWEVGDKFSPRVWSGKPYASKQITLAEDIEVKKVWSIQVDEWTIIINGMSFYNPYTSYIASEMITFAENDGLNMSDLFLWLKMPCKFEGQIICWDDKINYR